MIQKIRLFLAVLALGWSTAAVQAGVWDWLFGGHRQCQPCPGEDDIVRVVWRVVEEPVCIPGCNGHCGKVRMVRRVIRSEVRTKVPTLRWEVPDAARACDCPTAVPADDLAR
ncbi:MAG: hypothetical protein JNM56_30395 [Planctomycetia bacterium]|nr:hypothetical protein [Planctomycetia bacterium]